MRLFVGLPVPFELARTLVRFTQAIELPKGRRTPLENIHLTLVFLGEVAESVVPSIEGELSKLTFASFPIKIAGLNTFPRAGILFAEIEPARPLLRLQAQVAEGIARCGFVPEERPYHPHLTLARFRGPLRFSEHQRALPSMLQHSFSAETVNLYRSSLTPAGSRYEVLAQKMVERTG